MFRFEELEIWEIAIEYGDELETVNLLHFAKRRNYISELAFKELYNKVEVLIKKIRAFKNSLKG